MGQFQTGTIDEVRENSNKKSENTEYKDPTNTLPTPPPIKCKEQCDTCKECTANKLWWDKYPELVDEVMLKSNVHKCNSKCMNNKYNTCKARFPRDIVKETKADINDGSITMKKHEEWINFVTTTLTYLIKSNSDVTSLLSGTAIKAIVAYVTDYITKVPLKTHAMFDTVRTVFDRKATVINGDNTREEKARKLITSIVNSLTANLEIGGPMASLYLLGNPDHYTNYKFRPFYWRPYVNHNWRDHKVTSENVEDDHDKIEDNLLLLKMESEYIGYSPTLDYIHRPTVYEDTCLYDWIRRFDKKKIYKRKPKAADNDELDGYDTDNLEQIDEELDKQDLYLNKVTDNDDLSDDELDIMNDSVDEHIIIETKPKARFHFLSEHPQSSTHSVKLLPENKSFVPNFVCPVPRADSGDREYYCASMMSLFKPWRKADDLKLKSKTWDEAYYHHQFDDKQKELMVNFNIRYECHDAKDDYRLQRNKKILADDLPPWMSENFINECNEDMNGQEQLDEYVTCQDDQNDEDDNSPIHLGKASMSKQLQMKQMKNILRTAGWMENSVDGYDPILFDQNNKIDLPQKTSNAWQTLLTQKKKEILKDRLKQMPEMSQKESVSSSKYMTANEVVMVGEEYLLQSAKLKYQEDIDRITKIIKDFTLNEEQERAFRIVAQHACLPQSEQLKMYLGSMGGTGKSQVIKSLIQFFKERNEPHRFMVLAPTGYAAVLVDGSTYHSVLGVRDIESDSNKTRSQIKDRTEGVEYIFVDEVSMVSCRDMYIISKQLALSQANADIAFGGVNVIFAGDFAQLPPVMAKPLYDFQVGTSAKAGMSPYDQECAIGKAVWHQITTVVILKQNMRQRSQTPKDASFRSALENMRYKSCTDEDITFLRSLIANNGVSLSQKKFIHVPIITSYNSHRDAINSEGARLFATRYNAELHSFYSLDTMACKLDIKTKGQKRKKNPVQYLSQKYQEAAWNVPPSSSEHVSGRLDLCKGMPVMIKKNIATECCVTNGAPAIVYDWDSSVMPDGKEVLETLFVQLIDPPRSVQLNGLPLNVVPLPKQKHTIECQLPNDKSISINRQQVYVLPNFAMTVHASQGRTRVNNVCDLSNCINHLAYYTALSRSSSADGTAILQGFDRSKIQGGITGFLRQEFREIEVLNEITTLKFHGKLSNSIKGHIRSILIHEYYKGKPLSYVPEGISKDLAWSKESPFIPPTIDKNTKWGIVTKNKKTTKTGKVDENKSEIEQMDKEVKESQLLVQSIFQNKLNLISDDNKPQSKRKLEVNDPDSSILNKPAKQARVVNVISLLQPISLKWSNNSCAYDVVILSLYQIWSENIDKWSKEFNSKYKDLYYLVSSFKTVYKKSLSIEHIRYKWRERLCRKNSEQFNMRGYTDILELLKYTLELNKTLITKSTTCLNCSKVLNKTEISNAWYGSYLYPWGDYLKRVKHNKSKPSMQGFVNHSSKISIIRIAKCCTGQYSTKTIVHDHPDILSFILPDFSKNTILKNFSFNKTIKIRVNDSETCTLFLKCIIYFGGSHFIARIIDKSGTVWYFDSLNENGECIKEGLYSSFTPSQLIQCEQRYSSCIIYAKNL